ncbi:sodium:proton exchanger [Streptomyces albidoflavus]|uniref:cation:proton antiporter domain-containing protein n=1 Tax=Streptomyces albidoflavus TaxID=1886 RepID=UPI00101E8610|nr:cation:proton antiporter [Streptomyces albidoflavus]RZD89983.1 sodium:proton exchanger [Streptomyces albidoflavus]RZD93569.1 sodium:proton exchanger [Streptomyces albidoflavus]
MIALFVLLSLLFLWGTVSRRLARWSVTAPIAFAVAGLLLAGGEHPVLVLDMETHTFQRGVELVLAVMLFTDATEAREYGRLEKSVGEVRLLALALPASVVLAVLAGALLFPGTSWWLLGVTALVVMPMDLAPILMFLRDERVPLRVRAALNIEGGFNDGLISPLFVFCVANLVTAEGDTVGDLVLDAFRGASYAVLAGSAVGLVANGAVRRSLAAGWATATDLRLAGLALPFVAYAASVLLGGNGFVAAFVAGLWYARTARALDKDHLSLAHDAAYLMSLAVWFTFGKLIADEFAEGADLAVIGYALLALTVARMVPVVLSLIGTSFSWPERWAIGWLGSRGVTSIVFAVLAYTQLPSPDGAFVVNAMSMTVLLSIFLHGITVEPVARWFERRARPSAVVEKE